MEVSIVPNLSLKESKHAHTLIVQSSDSQIKEGNECGSPSVFKKSLVTVVSEWVTQSASFRWSLKEANTAGHLQHV